MNIGTPGAAYGPGFSMSRPVLGRGNTGQRVGSPMQIQGRPLALMPTRQQHDPIVNHREIVNRMVGQRLIAPMQAAPVSPLMQAHAQVATQQTQLLNPVDLTPPLTARPDVVNAAWGEPGAPRGGPPPTGLRSGANMSVAQIADLLARARIVNNARRPRA